MSRALPTIFALLLVALPASGLDAQETRQTGAGLRASKLIGLPVIGQDHVKVGKIEDILLDGEGRVRSVVIAVGGFLGVGEKRVAVPLDQLAFNTKDVPLTGGPTSVVTPANAPSAADAAKTGPDAMPGGGVADDALQAVPDKSSGTVDPGTGAAGRRDATHGRATRLVGEPVEAEVRMTKAALQAAPDFRYD